MAGSARSLRSLAPQTLASLALPERSSVEWEGGKRERKGERSEVLWFFKVFIREKEEMDNVDYKGRKNVCRLAISHFWRKKIEVEQRMKWFKKLGVPIKNELIELFQLNEELKKYERELND